MKKSLLAITLASVLIASVSLFRPQSAEIAVPSASISQNVLGLSADFLEQLYNPSIGLCRETLVVQNSSINASNGTKYERSTNSARY